MQLIAMDQVSIIWEEWKEETNFSNNTNRPKTSKVEENSFLAIAEYAQEFIIEPRGTRDFEREKTLTEVKFQDGSNMLEELKEIIHK